MTSDDQPPALHPETALICAGRPGHAAGGPLNVPVVLASNFYAGPGPAEDGRAYSRTDATPGWEALETAVGQLEGGHAVAFSSGMAAVAAVLDLVPAGGRIVAPADCYFGVGELLEDARQHRRWAVDRVDLTALCAAGRRAGALVGVDNTFATPLLQQPLALGADVAVHSATKFIGGHSDLLCGITTARDPALAGRIRHRRPHRGPALRRPAPHRPRHQPGRRRKHHRAARQAPRPRTHTPGPAAPQRRLRAHRRPLERPELGAPARTAGGSPA